MSDKKNEPELKENTDRISEDLIKKSDQEENLVSDIDDNIIIASSSKSIPKTVLEFFCALLISSIVSIALTWPAAGNLHEILLGGGELGGWLWRHWWHFEEVRALEYEEIGLWGSIEALIALAVFLATSVVGNVVIVLNLNILLIQLLLFGVKRSKYGVVPNGFINRN